MSDENQETISDIVAEKRREAQDILRINDTPWGRREALDLTDEADRIEAAYKREREATCKSLRVGNSAAMREVLDQIANMGEQIDNQLGSSEETVYAFRNERCIAHNISECARSALSALPRNCDRPECATTKSAQDTWRKEDGGKTAYYEWLLATSTKGETNGSK